MSTYLFSSIPASVVGKLRNLPDHLKMTAAGYEAATLSRIGRTLTDILTLWKPDRAGADRLKQAIGAADTAYLYAVGQPIESWYDPITFGHGQLALDDDMQPTLISVLCEYAVQGFVRRSMDRRTDLLPHHARWLTSRLLVSFGHSKWNYDTHYVYLDMGSDAGDLTGAVTYTMDEQTPLNLLRGELGTVQGMRIYGAGRVA